MAHMKVKLKPNREFSNTQLQTLFHEHSWIGYLLEARSNQTYIIGIDDAEYSRTDETCDIFTEEEFEIIQEDDSYTENNIAMPECSVGMYVHIRDFKDLRHDNASAWKEQNSIGKIISKGLAYNFHVSPLAGKLPDGTSWDPFNADQLEPLIGARVRVNSDEVGTQWMGYKAFKETGFIGYVGSIADNLTAFYVTTKPNYYPINTDGDTIYIRMEQVDFI